MSSTLEVLDKICQKSILGLWPWSNCCFVNFFKSLLKEKETLKKKVGITRQLRIHWHPNSFLLHFLYYLWTFPEILSDFFLPVTVPVASHFLFGNTWSLEVTVIPSLGINIMGERKKEIQILTLFHSPIPGNTFPFP